MVRATKNILFIMFDQLRFDYLSCAGHKTLHTPHMDALAARGVRFSRCYVQSPVCGASRMSFYTGRYVHSHGAAWNNFPLKVGELTLGDHLRVCGAESWLIGKTHMKVDLEGMERLGLSLDSVIGARVGECGFDVFARDDGLWGEGPNGFYDSKRSPYNEYLKQKGYPSENPWHDFANAGIDEAGHMASGWFMEHADKPANIREEDSETPWLTGQAIDFLDQMSREKKDGWLCHLSYIKPHWPYIAPEPYHAIYGAQDIQAPCRDNAERIDPHPVYDQFMRNPIGRAFQRDEVREKVIPAYMGLIKQCDDQMGRLFAHLERLGRMEDTMIVITSDHGDYLGDHWLGEKDLFHEQSVKVPLIIYDPSCAADKTRGSTCDELVESIDLVPTFIEALGARPPAHIVEGRSLKPFLEGSLADDWRSFAVSEYDFSATQMAANMGLEPKDARLFMVATKRWKLIHAEGRDKAGPFRPMLFDLESDPEEFHDLGANPAYAPIIAQMYDHLGQWARRGSQRTAISDEQIIASRGGSDGKGILIGVYEEVSVPDQVKAKYKGKAKGRYVS